MTSVQDTVKEIVQLTFSLMGNVTGLWFCGLDGGGELLLLLICLSPVMALNMCFPLAVNLETMCADDLLSVLLYLLVKTEIPNW